MSWLKTRDRRGRCTSYHTNRTRDAGHVRRRRRSGGTGRKMMSSATMQMTTLWCGSAVCMVPRSVASVARVWYELSFDKQQVCSGT
jgi:hypothetical protein